jgi:GDP-L-fucose synthase
LWNLTERFENDLFNIGAGEEHSIRTFAGLIGEIVGYPVEKIGYDTDQYVGAVSKCLNVEKISAALGPLGLTPLRDGLARTIEWVDSNGCFALTAKTAVANR